MSVGTPVFYGQYVIWPCADENDHYTQITDREGRVIHIVLDSYQEASQAIRTACEWLDANKQKVTA